MKGFTTLATALVALALVGTASAATTVVRITGSTAYRGAVHAAIAHYLGASGGAPYTLPDGGVYGYTGTSGIAGASQAIFIKTTGSDTLIIKTSWSGSVGGVQTVSAGNINVNYVPDSSVSVLTSTGKADLTGADPSPHLTLVGEIPDVAMSDTFQSSTPFVSNILEPATLGAVGVVPFKWVASNGAPASLTNITPQLAQALFGSGQAPLSLFTGNSADTSTVFAIGRDPDSGTRLTALAETALGANATIVQWHPTISGTAVTSQALEAPTTINGIPIVLGNGGYASGGTLANVMRNTTTAINGTYVTYLSTGDANTAITGSGSGAGPGKELQYNGVLYSTAALYSGQYTFWSYEHLLYRSDIVEDKKVVANAIADQIRDVDATIKISDMKVSRQTDGGTITSDQE